MESPTRPSCLSFVSGHGTVAADYDGILCKGDDGKVKGIRKRVSYLSHHPSRFPGRGFSLILETFILKDTPFPCTGTDKLLVRVAVNTGKLPLTPE